jgi:hypothetical protein
VGVARCPRISEKGKVDRYPRYLLEELLCPLQPSYGALQSRFGKEKDTFTDAKFGMLIPIAPSTGHFRVKPVEFDASVGSSELPVDFDGTPATIFEPMCDEALEPFLVTDPLA